MLSGSPDLAMYHVSAGVVWRHTPLNPYILCGAPHFEPASTQQTRSPPSGSVPGHPARGAALSPWGLTAGRGRARGVRARGAAPALRRRRGAFHPAAPHLTPLLLTRAIAAAMAAETGDRIRPVGSKPVARAGGRGSTMLLTTSRSDGEFSTRKFASSVCVT